MKILPAFKNVNLCDFMIDMTQDCVKHYQLDVARDVVQLYRIAITGTEKKIMWGVRECGTQLGFADSDIIQYYKIEKMIVLFRFEHVREINGVLYGDVIMESDKKPFEEKDEIKWYNENGLIQSWCHVDDEYDRFCYECREIINEYLYKE